MQYGKISDVWNTTSLIEKETFKNNFKYNNKKASKKENFKTPPTKVKKEQKNKETFQLLNKKIEKFQTLNKVIDVIRNNKDLTINILILLLGILIGIKLCENNKKIILYPICLDELRNQQFIPQINPSYISQLI